MHDILMMEIRKEQPFSLIPIDTFGHNLVTVMKNHLSEARILGVYEVVAGREGFEPPEVLPSTVFKTAALSRSAISRQIK